jgi:hypothetical protein
MACPVALAVRRVVKDKVRIEVRDLSVLIEIPEHLIHIENGMVMNDDVHTLGQICSCIVLSYLLRLERSSMLMIQQSLSMSYLLVSCLRLQ